MSIRRKRETVQKVAISRPLEPFTDLAKLEKIRGTIYGIHNLDAAILAMGSSNKKMGIAMGEYREGRDNYSPSTISHWRHPRAGWSFKMKREHHKQVNHVLDDWVKRELNSGAVRVQMIVNSPWHCWVEVRCGCGHWIKIDFRKKSTMNCKECDVSGNPTHKREGRSG